MRDPRNRQAVPFQEFGPQPIGGQENVEGGAVADLRVQLARRGGGKRDFVFRRAAEVGGQTLGRFREIGCDRSQSALRAGRKRPDQNGPSKRQAVIF